MLRLAVLGVLVAGTAAYAASSDAVAVLDIQGTGVEGELLPTLTEILTTELAQRGTYKVIAGRDIQSMLGFEQQKDMLGCTDTACLAEIGGALGVDRIVASHIGKVGSTYVVNIKLINIRTASTEARVYETVRGEVDALIGTIRASVMKLLGKDAKQTATAAASADQPQQASSADRAPARAEAPQTADSPPAAELSTGEPASIEAQATGDGASLSTITWVLFGVGAVGLAGGTTFGILAKRAEARASPELAGSQRNADRAPAFARAANVQLGVGALALAGGLAWWLFVERDSNTAPTASLTPVVTRGALGLSFGGVF